MLLAAEQQSSPQAAAALETLCRTYWYPLYAYVRRRGYGPEDAQDLTQDFFAQLLRKNYPARADRVKGRFRTFLLHTLNQFLMDQRERALTPLCRSPSVLALDTSTELRLRPARARASASPGRPMSICLMGRPTRSPRPRTPARMRRGPFL